MSLDRDTLRGWMADLRRPGSVPRGSAARSRLVCPVVRRSSVSHVYSLLDPVLPGHDWADQRGCWMRSGRSVVKDEVAQAAPRHARIAPSTSHRHPPPTDGSNPRYVCSAQAPPDAGWPPTNPLLPSVVASSGGVMAASACVSWPRPRLHCWATGRVVALLSRWQRRNRAPLTAIVNRTAGGGYGMHGISQSRPRLGTVLSGGPAMRKSVRRLAAATVVGLAPMAVVTVATPGVSLAQCENGSWWNPVVNVCQPPPPVCENGWWWDPVADVCSPPLVRTPTPLVCENGWWWDSVANVCQPPVLPPPP